MKVENTNLQQNMRMKQNMSFGTKLAPTLKYFIKKNIAEFSSADKVNIKKLEQDGKDRILGGFENPFDEGGMWIYELSLKNKKGEFPILQRNPGFDVKENREYNHDTFIGKVKEYLNPETLDKFEKEQV